jgi:hypothetical protein
MSGGVALRSIDPRIIENAMEQARAVTKSQGGLLAWPALLRKLDRSDPDYKN